MQQPSGTSHTAPSPRGADPIPGDATALLVGRIQVPGVGPVLVQVVRDGAATTLVEVTDLGPTMSDLLERPALALDLQGAATEVGRTRWSLDAVVAASLAVRQDEPYLLSPFDLSALKAAGVTFARSMMERVVEEHANGDPVVARELRERLGQGVHDAVTVTPGSPEAARAKQALIAEGLWSQYLEVGIGPDPEIFTKGQPLSSVGYGHPIGVLARSTWNNPEPEVVLAVTSDGLSVGATLGNDVNLRDFEGRSALLLAEAKDNNCSAAIGPFVRVFDEHFTAESLRQSVVELVIEGTDGFTLSGRSPIAEMSRTFDELVNHTWGAHHQYPDGFALFTGTMFAPTKDRDVEGEGFTHHVGDQVTISNPELGSLVNTVMHAEQAPAWQFGVRALMINLAQRDLLRGTGVTGDPEARTLELKEQQA